MSPSDFQWMDLALSRAEQGRGWVEPNPLVGSVVVREGAVVGVGHHERYGGPHAEVVALEQAGAMAEGATLYVTLEPCCHIGKTPPCTKAILKAGITRVVAAIRDPFPRVSGGGIAQLRQAGITVDVGLRAEAVLALNAPYLKRVVTGSPYVTAKWAMTLDGKTAVSGGDSQWISSAESRAQVHRLRGRVDAIVVGIGTVLADDPLLTARPPGPRTATRVVLDTRAQTPVNSRLARTASDAPVLIVTGTRPEAEHRRDLEALGCEILECGSPSRVDIGALLTELGHRELTQILVEGGGRVLGSFLDEGHVDEVDVYIAPILEGGDHARTAARGRGVRRMLDARRLEQVAHEQVGGDLRIRGILGRPWRAAVAGLGREDDTASP